MYATPEVYMSQLLYNAPDVLQLVLLYLIANKYHFASHEKFAGLLIQRYCQSAASSMIQGYFKMCLEAQLCSVLRIASLTREPPQGPLSTVSIQQQWLQLWNCTRESIACASKTAETLGLRDFQMELFYLELTRMKPTPVPGSSAYVLPTHEDLAPHQKLILYQGNWSLRINWSKVRNEALKKTFPNSELGPLWRAAWEKSSERETRLGMFDQGLELATLEMEFSTQSNLILAQVDLSLNICPMSTLDQMLADLVHANLPIHFLGTNPHYFGQV
ncbi:hypothetical protein BDN70DRAFT_990307 [Pholiota conissans]|uniref:Uncharacterized protein n=1 Tax=Pholiota conissans TaxID=109636 RepID=A0A9P5ZB43_9AGAR|nr:hypothetical protein BDN70DRAFT_990307 [Pholiota conissans]